MRTVLAVVAALALVGAGGPSPADEGGDAFPAPGSRLRLRVGGESAPVVGTLVSEDGESVTLRVASRRNTRVVKLEAIDSIDVSRPRTGLGTAAGILAGAGLFGAWVGSDAAWGGALLALPGAAAGAAAARRGGSVPKGALVGAGTSAAVFAGLALVVTTAEGGDSWWSDSEVLGAAAVTGVVLGALSGGVAAAVGHERWQVVPERRLRVSVMPVAGRGLGAAVHVTF